MATHLQLYLAGRHVQCPLIAAGLVSGAAQAVRLSVELRSFGALLRDESLLGTENCDAFIVFRSFPAQENAPETLTELVHFEGVRSDLVLSGPGCKLMRRRAITASRLDLAIPD